MAPSETLSFSGPLVGLRALDIGQLIAGPMAATMLADYGADVVKIEPPGAGDALRQLAPHKNEVPLWWKVNGRNKRSIALDFKDPDDLLVFYELVKAADVVVENFSPGTVTRLKVDYDTLSQVNSSIVMLSISGYGQYGPYSHRRGFGRTAEAFSGMAYANGYPDRPPVHAAFPIADAVSGVMGALSVMAALYERERNGQSEGQYIDLALYETPFRLMEHTAIQFDQLGTITERTGVRTGYVYPVGTWMSKDNKYVSFTGSTQAIVERLFDAMDHPEFRHDERFTTNAARMEHSVELEAIISAWVGARNMSEILEVFEANDVAAASYLNIKDIYDDPHYAARENLVTIDDPDLGPVRMQAVVPKFSRTPGRVRTAGPTKIGGDRDSVLDDWLGSD